MVRTKYPSPKKEERNQEFENVLGNLLVAENQVTRLKTRLVDLSLGMGDFVAAQTTSTYPFIYKNKLYKVHIQFEKVGSEKKDDDELDDEAIPIA